MLDVMSRPVVREDPSTVLQSGRRKAYRPLPWTARRAALQEALAAYARDEWFLAHELLEPAWMGTADLPERELYQGLIKLAAAHVHRIRGNPTGFARHLGGARALLRAAADGRAEDAGLDLSAIGAAIDDRLQLLAALGGRPLGEVPPIALPRRP
jgi:predicted metal-dependent hydrolase